MQEIEKKQWPDKFKVVNWFEGKTRKIFYGIDCRIDGVWYHMTGDDGKPEFFDTKEGANENMKATKKNHQQ